jgi:hypothetical protein
MSEVSCGVTMEFERVLRTFTGFFDREGIRYAIVGGLAVAAWGRKRSTKDADFAVDLENQQRVISFSESLGYETLHTASSFSNHLHPDPALGRVDFMYLQGATADRVLSATTTKEVRPGETARVASPEHLAMMKALAMKNFPHRALFEGEDVRVLLDVPGVNREAVRDYFAQHGLLELFDVIDKTRRTT